MHIGLAGIKNGFMGTIDVRTDLGAPVAREFAWDGILDTDGWSKTELRSSVGTGNAVLTPNGAAKGLTIPFDSMLNFKLFDNEDDNGSSKRKPKKAKYELRFQIKVSDDDSLQKLQAYWRKNQNTDSQMQASWQMLLDTPAEKGKAGESSVSVEKA